MRWKLKDLLAESVHPVPEKAVLADFRHAKTTRSDTSGKKQNKTKLKKKKLAATKSTKALYQNKNCKTEK